MIPVGRKCCEVGCADIVVARNLCAAHYKRWQRHGHIYETRPHDWGSREKHPLYVNWIGIRRQHGLPKMCTKWHDFWGFVEDVKERPIMDGKPILKRRDLQKLYSIENVFWIEQQENCPNKNKRMREYLARNPRAALSRSLKRQYGITIEDYERMLQEQRNVCKICGKEENGYDANSKKTRRLAVDHCHKTNKVRGLLCGTCNISLGGFKDDINLLKRAIAYLNEHK